MEELNELNSFISLLIAAITVSCNYLIIYLFKKNDKELMDKLKTSSLKKMYIISFLTGLAVGYMPKPLNYILLIPTLIVFVAAETDLLMQQIYSITNIVGGFIGIILICSFNCDIFSYFKQSMIFIIILLILKLVKALNVGDIELILSLTPYFYLISYFQERPTFIELFLFYIAGSSFLALIINFRKYYKEKIKSFPFAVPACYCYSIYFFALNIFKIFN